MRPNLGQAGGIAAAFTTAASLRRGQRAQFAPFGGVTPLYALYSNGLAWSRPSQCAPRKSIFQDITQVIVIKQTIEHDF